VSERILYPLDPDDELARVNDLIRDEFPSFVVRFKSQSFLMKLIDVLLRIITFGRMTRFFEYVTTLGTTVYVPDDWNQDSPLSRAVTLRHERVHMRQHKEFGLLFPISYLFLPLPVVFAGCRRDFEMAGYKESLAATAEYYGFSTINNPQLRSRIVGQFVGPSYFWAWPFRDSVERWYDKTVSDIGSNLRGTVHVQEHRRLSG
jgi:hypothetical protein